VFSKNREKYQQQHITYCFGCVKIITTSKISKMFSYKQEIFPQHIEYGARVLTATVYFYTFELREVGMYVSV